MFPGLFAVAGVAVTVAETVVARLFDEASVVFSLVLLLVLLFSRVLAELLVFVASLLLLVVRGVGVCLRELFLDVTTTCSCSSDTSSMRYSSFIIKQNLSK